MVEEEAEVPQGYIDDEEHDTNESPKDPQERDAERGKKVGIRKMKSQLTLNMLKGSRTKSWPIA
jgi:hypothetical protein